MPHCGADWLRHSQQTPVPYSGATGEWRPAHVPSDAAQQGKGLWREDDVGVVKL